jgi:hypothetical protein
MPISCCVSRTSVEMPRCASSHGAARVWKLDEEVADLALDERHQHQHDRHDNDDHDQEHKADRERARHAPLEAIDQRIAEIREERREDERHQHRRQQPDDEADDADQDQPLPADIETVFVHPCHPSRECDVRHARALHTRT